MKRIFVVALPVSLVVCLAILYQCSDVEGGDRGAEGAQAVGGLATSGEGVHTDAKAPGGDSGREQVEVPRANGQSDEAALRVFDQSNHLPIEGAQVRALGSGGWLECGTTDSLGGLVGAQEFLPIAKHTHLQVQAEGYATLDVVADRLQDPPYLFLSPAAELSGHLGGPSGFTGFGDVTVFAVPRVDGRVRSGGLDLFTSDGVPIEGRSTVAMADGSFRFSDLVTGQVYSLLAIGPNCISRGNYSAVPGSDVSVALDVFEGVCLELVDSVGQSFCPSISVTHQPAWRLSWNLISNRGGQDGLYFLSLPIGRSFCSKFHGSASSRHLPFYLKQDSAFDSLEFEFSLLGSGVSRLLIDREKFVAGQHVERWEPFNSLVVGDVVLRIELGGGPDFDAESFSPGKLVLEDRSGQSYSFDCKAGSVISSTPEWKFSAPAGEYTWYFEAWNGARIGLPSNVVTIGKDVTTLVVDASQLVSVYFELETGMPFGLVEPVQVIVREGAEGRRLKTVRLPVRGYRRGVRFHLLEAGTYWFDFRAPLFDVESAPNDLGVRADVVSGTQFKKTLFWKVD